MSRELAGGKKYRHTVYMTSLGLVTPYCARSEDGFTKQRFKWAWKKLDPEGWIVNHSIMIVVELILIP